MKIAIFTMYVGPFPEYFVYWKRSAKYNKDISFFLITDQDMKSEDNITTIKMSLTDIKEKFQSKYNFKIYLDHPYKLCDYKTAIGDVFYDYIKAYDWWGYCDLDMIFGDIRSFITDDILNNHDVVFNKGHLSLYRNTQKIRNLYKKSPGILGINYFEGFKSTLACYLDEVMGMNIILKKNRIKTYLDSNNWILDIVPDSNPFLAFNTWETGYAEWNNGHLYWHYENGKKSPEKIYIHMQKRKLTLESNYNGSPFYIGSNKIGSFHHICEGNTIIYTPSIKKPKRAISIWNLIVLLKRKMLM